MLAGLILLAVLDYIVHIEWSFVLETLEKSYTYLNYKPCTELIIFSSETKLELSFNIL